VLKHVAALRRTDPPSKESYRLSDVKETDMKESVSQMSYTRKWGQQERERANTSVRISLYSLILLLLLSCSSSSSLLWHEYCYRNGIKAIELNTVFLYARN
jgi:hypothetical protein